MKKSIFSAFLVISVILSGCGGSNNSGGSSVTGSYGILSSSIPEYLAPGQVWQFKANVEPAGFPVVWSVDEGGGTVSASGLYTAPLTPGTYHVYLAGESLPNAKDKATFEVFAEAWTSANGSNFKAPEGIAVDDNGNVYIADSGNNRLVKMKRDGTFDKEWPVNHPTGIAIDDDNNIYAAEAVSGAIRKIGNDGNFVAGWQCPKPGVTLTNPHGLMTWESCLYVAADTSSDKVVRFSRNTGVKDSYEINGASYGKAFQNPFGIALFVRGGIIITDTGADQVYTDTDSEKKIFGGLGSGDGQFNDPKGVVCGHNNYSEDLFVVDSGNHRVQVFTTWGKYLAKWGSNGTGLGQFNSPSGIATDKSVGYIYVVDTGNNRIQRFKQIANFPW